MDQELRNLQRSAYTTNDHTVMWQYIRQLERLSSIAPSDSLGIPENSSKLDSFISKSTKERDILKDEFNRINAEYELLSKKLIDQLLEKEINVFEFQSDMKMEQRLAAIPCKIYTEWEPEIRTYKVELISHHNSMPIEFIEFMTTKIIYMLNVKVVGDHGRSFSEGGASFYNEKELNISSIAGTRRMNVFLKYLLEVE